MFYAQLFGSMWIQVVFGLLTMGIMIFIPVWGTVTYKHQIGKVTFVEAVTASMIIVFLTLLLSNIITYIIPNFLDKEYPEHLYNIVVANTTATMEKFGTTDEDIEKALERIKLEDFTPTAFSTLKSFGISLGLGLILSLIVALFASRPSKEVEIKPEA